MANPEHLKVLKQGVEAWNGWRKQHPDTLPNLIDADLRGIDLGSGNFRHAHIARAGLEQVNLSRADLVGAVLNGSFLSDADLSHARLDGANLTSVILDGARLNHANLSFANLRRPYLKGADFTNSYWQGTNVAEADLSEAIGLEEVTHLAPSTIGVDTIYLSAGKIPEAFLRGCGLPEPFIVQIPALVAALEPVQFYSCFISYSSEDQNFAERLHADLQAKGVRVWFAPHDLPIGARIRPALDESIRLHDKLLLVLSEHSVSSQWVEQEVETALAREREREGRTVLFPIRIDGAVLESKAGWPALLKNTRNVGDFTRWKERDAYRKAFDKLLRDLKAEKAGTPSYMEPDSLENRAVLSPRRTLTEEWDKVETSIIRAAKYYGMVNEGEPVQCSQLINQLHEEGKVREATREEFFILSKWQRDVTFNPLAPVEPVEAMTFANKARELIKALAVDTPPLT